MKASKTMTTIAAAALVSVIGLAYAQNSDSTLDPATNPQNPPSTVVSDQMPAQTDATVLPAEPLTPAAPSQSTTATDANVDVPAATPGDASSSTYSNQDSAALPERAPRSDRN